MDYSWTEKVGSNGGLHCLMQHLSQLPAALSRLAVQRHAVDICVVLWFVVCGLWGVWCGGCGGCGGCGCG